MTPRASSRTTVRRHPERGDYDRTTIDPILDEALFCHVGFVQDGHPFVIPTIHARMAETLYLHGSPASRMLRELERGVDLCVTVTLLDGVVLARSVYNSSMNYRSVVVLGRARLVEEREEKLAALAAIVEHVAPGRSADARTPSDKELAGTKVLAVALADASAKVRTGPPGDFEHDLDLPIWAGVVPVRLVAGAPETAPDLRMPVAVPGYAASYALRLRSAGDADSDGDGARPSA
jgi:nitroimidazol reductase NimA-like FMN-containing flavoprotein (pyridoxamine 5'-phosphate oxidase superfamily)